MRKIFTLTVTLILMTWLVACNAGGDAESAPIPPGPADDPANGMVSGGTAAAFVDILAGDTYHIKTRRVTEGVEINLDVYLKDGMYAQIYNGGGMSTITVSRDGKTYTLFTADKSYWVDDMPMDIASTPYYTGDLILAGSDTADFGGKNLPYDEYTDAFGDKKQYFTDCNTLAGIRAIDSFDTQDTAVLALDQDIPDSVFTVPDDYTQRTPAPQSPLPPAVTLTTGLTLDQVEQNARDAGYDVYDNFDYETRDGAPATPDTGFCFGDPDLFMPLYVMEFASESDAKDFADAMQSDVYHEYVQGKLVLEIEVSMTDDFTDDLESQLVSALFK